MNEKIKQQEPVNPKLRVAEVNGSPSVRFHNVDCMEFMKDIPDKFYDLAIVDPPYGLGKKLKPRGGMIGKYGSLKGMGEHSWDNAAPNTEYFNELFRVSKNQIIWGGNYFINNLRNTQCFIIWDKQNGDNPMSDCEMAWTSFENKVARMYSGHIFAGIGCTNYKPIHPTQKPILLYRWILQRFAVQGQKIIDTHGGSMSSAVACDMEGFDLDICEIDSEYFEKGVRRFQQYKSQKRLF